MNYKPKPVCGFSITPHYLNIDLLQVSRMTVARNKEGELYWYVLPKCMTFENHAKGWAYAAQACKLYHVEGYVGYTKGRLLSEKEVQDLRVRGLLAHLK